MGQFKNVEDTVALLSGRFDVVHPGHIVTILRLLKKFSRVLVVMLDYPERRYPVCYCVDILQEIFEGRPVEILVNNVHFGEITEDQLKDFNFDVYAAGNLKVLRHIEKLGFDVIYTERSYLYDAHLIPMPE